MKKLIFLIVNLLFPLFIQANEVNKAFYIQGEQLDIPIPQEAKLAFTLGDPNGIYLVEYTNKNDNVEQWKSYLITDERYPKNMGSYADFFLFKLNALRRDCPSIRFSVLEEFINPNFTGQSVALAYFCAENLPQAENGEGALLILLEGEDYYFSLQKSWRPQFPVKSEDKFGIASLNILMDFAFFQQHLGVCNPALMQNCLFNRLNPAKNSWKSSVQQLSEQDLKRFTQILQ